MSDQLIQGLMRAIGANHQRLPANQIALAEIKLRIKVAIVNEGRGDCMNLAAIQSVERVFARHLNEFYFASPQIND